MQRSINHRHEYCPACRKPAAGDGEHCIFCGAGLLTLPVNQWRAVYHAYSYADALLATSALKSHGLTARLSCAGAERALTGNANGVVQVASGEHLRAQEVLRQIRGVRTDTEYLEWQALKGRAAMRRGILIGAIAALAAAAGVAVSLVAQAPDRPASARSDR